MFDIIVPYKKDFEEREENKKEFLDHYSKYFNIILIENYDERYDVYNKAAETSSAEYIALADIDAIIPIEQINEALFKLENGADMVYPYTHIVNVQKDGSLTDDWPKDFIYGLMVLFNRKKFIDFGGENTEFKGYGWEDLERYYRALNFNYKIERVEGNAYHLVHPRVGFKNPFFAHNMSLMKKEKNKWLNMT
mgnify:CR=1 FL=1